MSAGPAEAGAGRARNISPAWGNPARRVVRMNSGAPTRASSALIVWLIAEGDTPRSPAAAEKLRRSATRRKASIPSSALWGIVKSCFKALADYRGLSICAIASKKVAQRNERNRSHGLSALLFPPLPFCLCHRRRLGACVHRPDRLDRAGLCPAEGGRPSLRRPRRSGAHRRRWHGDRKSTRLNSSH